MFGRGHSSSLRSDTHSLPASDLDSKAKEPLDVESSLKNTAPLKSIQEERGVFDVAEGENTDDNVKLMGWQYASVLVVKVAYGIGVMGIPATFSTLGFVGGIICLLVLWAISTLSAVYVARIRLRHPHIANIADFGAVLGGPVMGEAFGLAYIILMILVSGAAISTVTIALNAVSSHAICTVAWAGVACGIVFIFGAAMPDMERVAFISWIGLACIFFANWILTIAVLVKGNPPARPAGESLGVAVKVSPPFWSAMSAVTSQLFACTGSPMFFSISAEMKHPEQFVRSTLVGNTFLIANYIIIGCCMYARAGKWLSSPAFNTAGHTFRIICYAVSLFGLFVSCLLLTHLGAKYMFVRVLRGTRHLAHHTPMHRIVWAASFFGVLTLGFVLSQAIPVFSQLVSLVGALTGGVLVVILTSLLMLYSLSDDPTGASPANEKDPSIANTGNWLQQACRRGTRGTWKERATFISGIAMFILGLFITGAGLYGTVESIIQTYKAGEAGHAFSCADNSV